MRERAAIQEKGFYRAREMHQYFQRFKRDLKGSLILEKLDVNLLRAG
jgi:hypothetical protein